MNKQRHIQLQWKLPTLLTSLIVAALLSGCSTTRSVQPDTRSSEISTRQAVLTDDTYRIRPGDEIEILVWEQPSFNTLTIVSSNGLIAVPLVGELQVGGLTQDEFRRDLERRLSEYIRSDLNLTISIRNTDSLIVSVFGMVTRPDNYPIVDQTSIFRILSSAGGPTPDANLKGVKVYKNNNPEGATTLDLTAYLESGQMNSPSIMINPGDIVYIPRKENAVRDMSEFLRDVVVLFGIFRVFN
jgi:protein involved in polysaccharide export with SLBB domain